MQPTTTIAFFFKHRKKRSSGGSTVSSADDGCWMSTGICRSNGRYLIRAPSKVGVLRDSHYLFLTPCHIGYLNDFLARKRKKTVPAGLRLKNSNGVTTVPERAIVALYYSGFFGK
jgi:hypothetical protein